jgi:hypothetical protein
MIRFGVLLRFESRGVVPFIRDQDRGEEWLHVSNASCRRFFRTRCSSWIPNSRGQKNWRKKVEHSV